jgi:hypothetical protein
MGPLGEKEYYLSMDRYCGFAYSELIEQLIFSHKIRGLYLLPRPGIHAGVPNGRGRFDSFIGLKVM